MTDVVSKKLRQTCLLIVIGVSITTIGCQRAISRAASAAAGGAVNRIVAQPDTTVDLLEAELRWMEDNLYRMDHQLDATVAKLQSAHRNNAILRLELAESRRQLGYETVVSDGSLPTTKSNGTGEPKKGGSNDDGKFDEDDLNDEDLYNLDIDLGDSSEKLAPAGPELNDPELDSQSSPRQPIDLAPTPDNNLGIPETEIRMEALPEPPTNRGNDSPTEVPKPNPFPDEGEPFGNDDPDKVTRIRLNPQLTGGYSFDDEPGHEGIVVVIEPQNGYAKFVPVAGDVTVEVFDPAKSGLEARVGKWKYTALEANSMIKKTIMGEGVHLQLPWPGAPPNSRNLKLNVNYELANGRKFAATKDLIIEPMTSALVEKADAAERGNWSPYRSSPVGSNRFESKQEETEVADRVPSLWLPNR